MGSMLALLTNASIENHDCHVWFYRFANLNHLLKQLGFLFMPSRRINDNDIKPFLLEFGDTLRCDSYRIRLRVRTEVGNFGLRCGLSSLVKGSSTERISANDA